MAAESILTYKKPGFPKFDNSEKSYRTVIEYVGPQSTLAAAEPAVNAAWGDYVGIVVGSQLDPIEGTSQANLTVFVEYNYNGAAFPVGASREVTIEVEWVSFMRPMLEHPEFRIDGGGTYELTPRDVMDIEAWKNEPTTSVREAFSYYDPETDSSIELSANAQKFCAGLNMGLETYEDFAPVIRKTTTFAGGIPGDSEAGFKDTPPTFTGRPAAYEWRKSADRSVRSSGQTRWDRVEEWVGAIKVLVDKDAIYF
jgi:hypothetical protein